MWPMSLSSPSLITISFSLLCISSSSSGFLKGSSLFFYLNSVQQKKEKILSSQKQKAEGEIARTDTVIIFVPVTH